MIDPAQTALFMVAFLPQFVDHRATDFSSQIMVLGCIYALLTIIVYTVLGAAAALLSNILERRPRIVHGLNAGAGVVFLLSGLKVATFDPPR